jgi:hypothetical protein
MPSLDPLLETLNASRSELLHTADSVAPGQWLARPAAKAWSAAEVIAHLIMVERTVTDGASRVLLHPPKPLPFFRRLHWPLWIVARRILRRKSPIPLDPALLDTKENMLAELRAARERTLAFLTGMQGRDLSAYSWPHPFLGNLNFYDWFRLLANHEVRHTKQILEIVDTLRK